jgi:cytochrome bd-type quinol oxidase subunit 2
VVSGQAEQAARATGRGAKRIADSRWFETSARAGFVGSGIVHLLIGWLVVLLAIGTASGSETDQSGALQQLADAPGGVFLLWLIAVGTAALAVRLALEAVVGGRSDSARAWGSRLKDAAKAVVYGVVCWSAVSFATGAGSSSSGSSRSAAAKALATPGGVFVLFLAAAIAVGVGVALVVKGARRSFRKDLDTPPRPYERVVTVLGTVGYVGKGIAIVVVGVLIAVAAVRSDPDQATGLDGAFDALHEMPGGGVVLVAVGVGFLAYGVYSFFRARYARL